MAGTLAERGGPGNHLTYEYTGTRRLRCRGQAGSLARKAPESGADVGDRPMKCAAIAALLALVLTSPAMAQDQIPERYQPRPYVQIAAPAWSRDAVLYQINTRQFTPEGTFVAAQRELPRLRALGVDILWIMPIQPIGIRNRKGSLGSPYSIRDYRAVNPEYGTIDDFKAFVAAAHAQGFHVILDWVANHSAWDNPLAAQHPDWYDHDWDGDFRPTPWLDWSDIIDFDYDSAGLRQYMAQSMAWWVTQTGIDGFRCDVAGLVPVDFWTVVRADLERIKPVFMLAEWQSPELHRTAFDASYAWDWYNAMHDIAQGRADAGAIVGYYSGNATAWPRGAMRMLFTSNHDKNSWDGTEFEQFGPALEATTVLSFVSEGIPLIYNGQEAGNDRRLAFFERDPIIWRDHPNGALYRRLIAFRKSHRALDNGAWGAPMVRVVNSAPAKVLSFVREVPGDKLLVLINLSGEAQSVTLSDGPFAGTYRDFASGAAVHVDATSQMALPAWGWQILTAP